MNHAKPSAPQTQETQDILAPAQPEGMTATLRTWLKHNGDAVVKNEPIAELETDKVIVEVSAPCAGVLEIIASEDSPVQPDTVLGRVTPQTAGRTLRMHGANAAGLDAEEPNAAPHTQAPHTNAARPANRQAVAEPQQTLTEHQAHDLRLSPAVRRLVAEHGIDPTRIHGTGLGGRLTREDVVQAIAAQARANIGHAGCTQIPHSPMRRRIAQHMQQSLAIAPHVTAVFEADLSAILRHRAGHKAHFAQQGINLTLTAYFVSAAAAAMRAVPEVNSRWHDDHLEVYSNVHVGVGTALGEQGLIVPVIHHAQHLSLQGIAARLHTLTQAARSGALKPQDVQHGTFTISNYGVSGALVAAPIILNQGQAAILGIGAIQKHVVVADVHGVDSLQIRPMAYVSLTIDHRVLNGDQANAWLTRFVTVIEDWT